MNKLIIGFTGKEFHFGDCMGADYQAYYYAKELGLYTVSHPPDNSSMRAFCGADKIEAPLPYLKRNQAIVDCSDILIATPDTETEKPRSGTWHTIRYALRKKNHLSGWTYSFDWKALPW